MKHFIIRTVIAALAFVAAQPIAAQDQTDVLLDKYTKAAHERDSLAARVKQLEAQLNKDTTALKKKHDQELKQLEKKFESQIKALENDTTAKANKIKKLGKDIEAINKAKDQKAVEALKKQIADLEKDTLNLRTAQRKDAVDLEAAKKEIEAKETELVQLRPFHKMKLEHSLIIASQWAMRPFSELVPDSLDKFLSDCREYGGNDEKFREMATTVKSLQTDLQLYTEARALLEKPYNDQTKEKARQDLKQLMAKYEGKPQQPEIENIDELLRDYDGNVLLFQELIANVDKEIETERNNQNPNAAHEMLRLMFEDAEQKEVMESIKTVPYLARLLERYKDDLSKNPLNHSAVEQEVKAMLPQ